MFTSNGTEKMGGVPYQSFPRWGVTAHSPHPTSPSTRDTGWGLLPPAPPPLLGQGGPREPEEEPGLVSRCRALGGS